MMIKLALLGAPSSGKTELASQLVDVLSPRSVAVVDDYILDIEQRSDNTLGHFATYLGNLQAAVGRWEYERQHVRDDKPDVLITCGSIVETAVYEAIHALTHAQIDEGSLTLRALQNDKRASVTMTLLGVMCFDTWDYHFSYYLPLEDKSNKWNEAVDSHILESADALGVAPKTLERESAVATILQDIVEHEQAEATASD
jgi:hypothetical protein